MNVRALQQTEVYCCVTNTFSPLPDHEQRMCQFCIAAHGTNIEQRGAQCCEILNVWEVQEMLTLEFIKPKNCFQDYRAGVAQAV
jgi:hypothetical protein